MALEPPLCFGGGGHERVRPRAQPQPQHPTHPQGCRSHPRRCRCWLSRSAHRRMTYTRAGSACSMAGSMQAALCEHEHRGVPPAPLPPASGWQRRRCGGAMLAPHMRRCGEASNTQHAAAAEGQPATPRRLGTAARCKTAAAGARQQRGAGGVAAAHPRRLPAHRSWHRTHDSSMQATQGTARVELAPPGLRKWQWWRQGFAGGAGGRLSVGFCSIANDQSTMHGFRVVYGRPGSGGSAGRGARASSLAPGGARVCAQVVSLTGLATKRY